MTSNSGRAHENNYYSGIRYDSLSLLQASEYQRILEIGGGAFETIEYLDPCNKNDLWGVDVTDKRTSNRIKFLQGSIEDPAIHAKIPDNYFDLVIANDVLEHLGDTDAFFKVCSAKLKSNGFLLVSLPNIRNIRAFYHIFVKGSFPRFETGLFDRTHMRWFTKKDLLKHSSIRFICIDIRSKGKLVPKALEKTLLAEFLALHNIALLQKKR